MPLVVHRHGGRVLLVSSLPRSYVEIRMMPGVLNSQATCPRNPAERSAAGTKNSDEKKCHDAASLSPCPLSCSRTYTLPARDTVQITHPAHNTIPCNCTLSGEINISNQGLRTKWDTNCGDLSRRQSLPCLIPGVGIWPTHRVRGVKRSEMRVRKMLSRRTFPLTLPIRHPRSPINPSTSSPRRSSPSNTTVARSACLCVWST